jgi:CheY-like chemotaxis protein
MAAMPQLLILDDDKTLVGVLARIAARFGWKVTSVTNKKEFLKALKTEHYDVVLTDYRMPKPFHWQNLNEELQKALAEHPAPA